MEIAEFAIEPVGNKPDAAPAATSNDTGDRARKIADVLAAAGLPLTIKAVKLAYPNFTITDGEAERAAA